MNNNIATITITTSTEKKFSVYATTPEEIKKYLRWIDAYKHGKITNTVVVCENEKDVFACKLEAKHLKLKVEY